MSTKILILQGSPRKNGNTDLLAQATAAGARAAGATVEKVYLGRKNIAGCIECYACQQHPDGPGHCAVKDDLQAVLKKIIKADVLVAATPVFCWGLSAQLKALLDRLFCTFRFRADDTYDSKLAGKGAALISTSGGTRNDGMNTVIETARRWQKFSRMKWRGQLLGPSLSTPKETAANRSLLARAEAFGRKLAM